MFLTNVIFLCALHYPLGASHRPPKGGILTIAEKFVQKNKKICVFVKMPPLGGRCMRLPQETLAPRGWCGALKICYQP